MLLTLVAVLLLALRSVAVSVLTFSLPRRTVFVLGFLALRPCSLSPFVCWSLASSAARACSGFDLFCSRPLSLAIHLPFFLFRLSVPTHLIPIWVRRSFLALCAPVPGRLRGVTSLLCFVFFCSWVFFFCPVDLRLRFLSLFYPPLSFLLLHPISLGLRPLLLLAQWFPHPPFSSLVVCPARLSVSPGVTVTFPRFSSPASFFFSVAFLDRSSLMFPVPVFPFPLLPTCCPTFLCFSLPVLVSLPGPSPPPPVSVPDLVPVPCLPALRLPVFSPVSLCCASPYPRRLAARRILLPLVVRPAFPLALPLPLSLFPWALFRLFPSLRPLLPADSLSLSFFAAVVLTFTVGFPPSPPTPSTVISRRLLPSYVTCRPGAPFLTSPSASTAPSSGLGCCFRSVGLCRGLAWPPLLFARSPAPVPVLLVLPSVSLGGGLFFTFVRFSACAPWFFSFCSVFPFVSLLSRLFLSLGSFVALLRLPGALVSAGGVVGRPLPLRATSCVRPFLSSSLSFSPSLSRCLRPDWSCHSSFLLLLPACLHGVAVSLFRSCLLSCWPCAFCVRFCLPVPLPFRVRYRFCRPLLGCAWSSPVPRAWGPLTAAFPPRVEVLCGPLHFVRPPSAWWLGARVLSFHCPSFSCESSCPGGYAFFLPRCADFTMSSPPASPRVSVARCLPASP